MPVYHYHIIKLEDDWYVFDYDTSTGFVDKTPMEIEARQFDSIAEAERVAKQFGGKVITIEYT